MADAVLARSSRCRRSRSGAAGGSGHDASSRSAAAAAPLPRSRGGETSSTVAPNTGLPLARSAAAPGSRSSTRSPTCSGSGWSRLSRAIRPPSIRTRATARAAPMCSVSWGGSRMVPGGCAAGAGAAPAGRRSRWPPSSWPGWMRAMPRPSSRVLTPAQVQRHPGDAADLGGRCAERLHAPDPQRAHGGGQHQLVPGAHGPGLQGPGDHGPAALDGEHPVQPEPDAAAPGRARGAAPRAWPSAAISSGRPWPVSALTATASSLAEAGVCDLERGLPPARAPDRPGRPG